jgi:hypothetical protein
MQAQDASRVLSRANPAVYEGQFGFVWEHQSVFAMDFVRKLRKDIGVRVATRGMHPCKWYAG